MMTPPMLDAALDHARRGWPILPLHSIIDGRCTCGETGCHSPGKHSRIVDWPNQATTDPTTIRRWWMRWPGANIGIPTGKASGFFVLDGDPRNGGDDTLRELEAKYGALPSTVESQTGGGGFHKLFKYPGPVKSGAGVLGPGLDVKADGGCIVAPPSLHASGRRYEWEASSHPDDVAIAEAPAWLLAMLEPKRNGNGQERLRVQERIREGERNTELYRLARSLKARELSFEAILAALRAENKAKCNPPLDPAEVEKIVSNAFKQPDRPEFAATGNSNSSGDPLAPLRALADSPTAVDIEAALRMVVKSLAGVDALKRATLRHEALSVLKAKKIGGAAKLVDAAWALLADKGGTDDNPADFLSGPELWAEPVDGVMLFDAISDVLRRYMVMTKEQADTCALWVGFAHSHDASQVSPILAVQSPVMGCGKSRLQAILAPMLPRALVVCNLGAATLFRTVEHYQPTLLIDEADTFMRENEGLRGIVNSGWLRSGAQTIRLVGDDYETRTFSTWCPKVIAAIGKLPPTIQDRSIVIALKRKADGEMVERFRIREANELKPLCSKAARWAKDNIETLRDATPEVPNSLGDRQADSWKPLLSIADLVGEIWPERARTAALILSGGERDPEADGMGVTLVADCVAVFKERGVDRLSTTDLIDELVKIEERSWSEWNKGKHITPRVLAKLLKPFGIKPKVLRIGPDTPSGYELLSFQDAYSRYVQGSHPQHCQQINENNELNPIFNPQHTPSVEDTKSDLSIEKERDVEDVEDRNPRNGVQGDVEDGLDVTDPAFESRCAADVGDLYNEEVAIL